MELFVNPEVMLMTDLTCRLVASINSKGIIQVKESTQKHIGGSMRELVKEHHNLKRIGKDVVARATIKLKADINSQDIPQAWPLAGKQEVECPTIPKSLSVFFCYLKGNSCQKATKAFL